MSIRWLDIEKSTRSDTAPIENANDGTLSVNGRAARATVAGMYAVVSHEWETGDVVPLDLPMLSTYYDVHPHLHTNRYSLALSGGPIIHCIEGHDQNGAEIFDCRLTPAAGKISKE